MDLCKWKTDSPELQQKWAQEQEQAKDSTPLTVLDLIWNSETDDFIFEMTNVINHVKDKKIHKKGSAPNIIKNIQSHWFLVLIYYQSKIYVPRTVGKRLGLG